MIRLARQACHLLAGMFLSVMSLGLVHAAPGPHAIDPDVEAAQAYSQASHAMAKGQWAQAEQWLERVLMYQPHNAAAQLELAELLAQRGAVELAQAMVLALMDDPRTPPPMRQGLNTLLQRYQNMSTVGATQANAPNTGAPAAKPAAQPKRVTAGWQVGWGINPANRTRADTIELTTGQGLVELPITSQSRPGIHQTGWLQWQPDPANSLQLQWQDTPVAQTAASVQLQWIRQIGPTWQLEINTRQVGSASRYNLVGLQYAHTANSASLGLFEDQERSRAGWFGRLQNTLQHSPHSHTSIFWLYENNRRSAGVGGSSHTWQIQHGHQFHARWAVQAYLRGYQEMQGYSQLLQNNAKRRMNTGRLALSYQLLAAQPSLTLQLHAEKRDSNLVLFRHTDAGLSLAITHKW